MDRVREEEGRALRRIVALLLALAQVADRAGSMSFPVRVVVLAILRHAEIVAWGFAFATASGPTARPRKHQPLQPIPAGAPVAVPHGPADAARLSLSLRALALIVACWAIRAVSSVAVSFSACGPWAPGRARTGGSWRGPSALPAPDTS